MPFMPSPAKQTSQTSLSIPRWIKKPGQGEGWNFLSYTQIIITLPPGKHLKFNQKPAPLTTLWSKGQLEIAQLVPSKISGFFHSRMFMYKKLQIWAWISPKSHDSPLPKPTRTRDKPLVDSWVVTVSEQTKVSPSHRPSAGSILTHPQVAGSPALSLTPQAKLPRPEKSIKGETTFPPSILSSRSFCAQIWEFHTLNSSALK